jgi:hypothetical protein
MSDELDVNHMLNDKIDTLERNLNRRLDAQDRALGEIKRQTQATNGRVGALEQARMRAQGVMFAFSWLPPVLTAVVTAGLTVLIIALTGGLH